MVYAAAMSGVRHKAIRGCPIKYSSKVFKSEAFLYLGSVRPPVRNG